jgi:CRP/FNR family cyclic AMP-dependent transcriptional regulator
VLAFPVFDGARFDAQHGNLREPVHDSRKYRPLGGQNRSPDKVAVIAIIGPNDFWGEGYMAGQSLCTGTATATAPTTLLSIDKNELLNMLRTQDKLSDRFVGYIFSHNNRVEENVIDQLFNSSEKRLARELLVL